jgi:hypothetical protein
MRTTWGVFLVLAIGASALMFGLSGYGAQYSDDPSQGLGPIGEDVNKSAENSSVRGGGVEGAASGSDEPLISFILNGASVILETAKLVVALPLALINLGFPAWFAIPVGSIVSIVTSIGIIQFITGRIYK